MNEWKYVVDWTYVDRKQTERLAGYSNTICKLFGFHLPTPKRPFQICQNKMRTASFRKKHILIPPAYLKAIIS